MAHGMQKFIFGCVGGLCAVACGDKLSLYPLEGVALMLKIVHCVGQAAGELVGMAVENQKHYKQNEENQAGAGDNPYHYARVGYLRIVYFNRGNCPVARLRNPVLCREVEKAFASKSAFMNVLIFNECCACGDCLLPKKGCASGRYVEIDSVPMVVVWAVDVSSVLETARILEENLRKEETTARERSASLAEISHEIRSPLNAIIGFSKLLLSTDNKTTQKKYAHIIDQNSKLIMRLVSDVLDNARMEAGTLEFNYTDTDVADLLETAGETVKERMSESTQLICMKNSGEPHFLLPRERVSQVLINFLDNAAKYTKSGTVTYGCDVCDDELYFYVKDTGIGIERDKQADLFKPFSRPNTQETGTGLGLNICREIVEKIGGEIGVESRGKGKGAIFWFTVPLRSDVQPDEPAADVSAETMAERKLPLVLVAEDNESNYLLCESILEDDYELLHALNGREAIEMALEHKPDVILMDLMMPDIDGYEATRQIREKLPDVPVIAVTAYAFHRPRKGAQQRFQRLYIKTFRYRAS